MSWRGDLNIENHMVVGDYYVGRSFGPAPGEAITDALCGGVHDCDVCEWKDGCWDAVDPDEEEEEDEEDA